MSIAAFFLIFMSAGLHASWNLIAKKSHMSFAFYAIMMAVDALMGAWIWFALPLKLSLLNWNFYAATCGAALGETLYCAGLILAYRRMDMSSAYPMMRSLPLLFTALVTALLGWGDPLSVTAKVGMCIVFAGCVVMPLSKFSDFSLKNYLDPKIVFVLMAACGTTSYTICDDKALTLMRECAPAVSKPMVSCSYYELRHIAVFLSVGMVALALPSTRAEAATLRRQGSGTALLAGAFAGLTYILVLLAMNYVKNVSYVQAFRQLGLVIGMLEGIFILKERCSATKVVGITLIVSGLVLTVL